jgi:hypothetical protein
MKDGEWSEEIEVDAPLGVDESGRLTSQTEVPFTCPECGSVFELKVILPWTSA